MVIAFAGKGTSIVLRDSPRTRRRVELPRVVGRATAVSALCGGGHTTTIVCGSLSFDRASLRPITGLLPNFHFDEGRSGTHACSSHHSAGACVRDGDSRRDLKSLRVGWLRFYLSRYSGAIASGPARAKDRFVQFSILDRRCSECHPRQSNTPGRSVPGRSCGSALAPHRGTFQRATRTTPLERNRVADPEGNTSY